MFKTNFDDVLDLCLDRIEAGETVENCLNDYPLYADALENPLEIAGQFCRLPAEKPSLAADYLFQQQLDLLVPDSIDSQIEDQHQIGNVINRIVDAISNMREPIFEFGFMALMIAVISLFFISRINLVDQEPTILQVAKESLSRDDLGNMNYQAALVGTIELKDGRYPLISKDYAGNPHEIQLGDKFAVGDVNGDGWKDAAVILYWRDQTKIPLWSLAIVENDKGEPKNVASLFLGPNLIVDRLEIIDEMIHITVIDTYGTRFTKIYQLNRSRLTLVNESAERKRSFSQPEESIQPLASNVEDEIDSMLSANRLEALSYPLEGRTVLFKDGIVDGEYFTTRLLDSEAAEGDLTNDGVDDTFVALLTQSSNSESVYFLSVVTDGDAEAVPITSLPTEDAGATLITANSFGYQMKLGSVELVDGAIVVEIAAKNNSDVNCKAIMETTYKFEMIEDELVAVSAN